MFKKIFIILMVFGFGFLMSFFGLNFISKDFLLEKGLDKVDSDIRSLEPVHREVIGFLPFWLLDKANEDYTNYITNLSVFSLIVDSDGTIKKYTKPTEGEPGYFSLTNGKFDSFISSAKSNKQKLSLVLFSGDDDDINSMIDLDPVISAKNLTTEVIPIAKKYGFDELNIDIEKVKDASPEARLNFKDFVSTIRGETNKNSLSLTIDVTASSFVKETNLVDPKLISPFVDKIIIMAYDYHYSGSSVTGPVAPENGAGINSEYDVETAILEALRGIEPKKIILGIPLYGYEWESIESTPRSATIPSTGLIISNRRAEELLEKCASCEAKFNGIDREMNIIYKDEGTGFYHQVFYPESKSMKSKLDLAEKYDLGGVALWALGYEGNAILKPLSGWSR